MEAHRLEVIEQVRKSVKYNLEQMTHRQNVIVLKWTAGFAITLINGLDELQSENDTLTRQRDELLAALHEARAVVRPFATAYDEVTENGNRPERWYDALDYISATVLENAAVWLTGQEARP